MRGWVFILGFLFSSPALAAGYPLPEGWQETSRVDLWPNTDDPAPWRKHYPNDALAVDADFDGDGIADHAAVLRSDNRHLLGLFVWQADMQPVKIYETSGDDFDGRAMGIEIAPAGRYTISCTNFKISHPCWTTVVLPYSGISVFRNEAYGSVFYYWNAPQNRFISRLMPD